MSDQKILDIWKIEEFARSIIADEKVWRLEGWFGAPDWIVIEDLCCQLKIGDHGELDFRVCGSNACASKIRERTRRFFELYELAFDWLETQKKAAA